MDRAILAHRLAPLISDELPGQVHLLGMATNSSDPLIRAALKDSSWGALPFLMRAARDPGLKSYDTVNLQLLVCLARDHAKMMRNAFSDLDEALQEADAARKSHPIRPILTKMAFLGHDHPQWEVGSNYEGFITSRCLETSALDRILYQFFHRAERSNSGEAGLWVVNLGNGLSRWVFTSTEAERDEWTPDELPVLAVALAVGTTPRNALARSYIGTLPRYGSTWSWFHWPIFKPGAGTPSCQCDPLAPG